SFPIDPSVAEDVGRMVLALPGDDSLEWTLPIAYDAGRLSPFGVTWGTILALLAGLLASMWPCLFQLTVFFIPTLAGMNIQDSADGAKVSVGQRASVVKAALFFVLGFTVVYTGAGAIIGYASQQLGDSPDFEQYQRYFGIGAGVLIIILAVRVAAKVRAPLVCKMPVLSGMSTKARQSPANPIELMLAGIAFATGCMTCFGAAMVVAMVVYVGMSSSALFGATILFLFSLGMAIPLVIAAVAMSKVLPLVFKLEKIVPWMGLASSILMIGFAVLLISGNYMAITEFFWRITGNPLGGG
ncbi:MAG: sulfite exporter TauE/SafE family protein, partial [Chloroflexi bacterium]|nr:sulfite exporter TauE/SafE family protein [Chloroflexota bacterium]